MIKKIKFELTILLLLVLNIIASSRFDITLHNFIKTNLYDESSVKIVFLREFFRRITEIGDSIWFFIISFFVFCVSYLLRKRATKHWRYYYNKFKEASLFLFVLILVSGLLTQIIKHVVGRPRPNHNSEKFFLDFNLFSFDSAFHSFPSGHTSTIFAVALFFSIFTPKIKYFYFLFAVIVSISRIAVGAHYFTDIVGGIAISFIGFKFTLFLFNKFKTSDHLVEIKNLNSNIFLLSIIVFILGIILVTVGWPIDVFISDLIYNDKKIFTLQNFDLITVLARKIFLPFLIIYILILPIIGTILPIKRIYFGFKFNFKDICFLWISALMNLIVVVNLLLKNIWGRARPNDITYFGGEESFTPWFQISNSCTTNCSFVSGDASVGFSLIVLFFLTKNKNFIWLALFSGLFLGIIRILEGGHFISDILIAGFLIFILTYLQNLCYEKKFK